VCFFHESRACVLDSRGLTLIVDDLDGGQLGSGEYEGSEHGSLLHSLGNLSSPASYLSSTIPSPSVEVADSTAIGSEAVLSLLGPAPLMPQDLVPEPEAVGKMHPFSHILRSVQKSPKETLHQETAAATVDDMMKSLSSGIADYCLLIGQSIVHFCLKSIRALLYSSRHC
jgi:hypothetical protein